MMKKINELMKTEKKVEYRHHLSKLKLHKFKQEKLRENWNPSINTKSYEQHKQFCNYCNESKQNKEYNSMMK